MELTSRDSLLQANASIISQLQDRLNVKRYRVNEADASKLGFINALVGAIKVQNEILQAAEIEEIKEEIEKLKR